MTESFLLARPSGDVEKSGVCGRVRVSASAPFGFHVRWFREDFDDGLTGATGFCLPPRSFAGLDAELMTGMRVALIGTARGPRLRLSKLPEDPRPTAVAIRGSLLDGSGVRQLEVQLAEEHPVDNLRRTLPLSGSEEWRWLHESCGLKASYLEHLHAVLREMPVEIEGLLWEAARDEEQLKRLLVWVGSILSWRRREDAWEQIGRALASDPEFPRSTVFLLLEAAGVLGASWPFARPERVEPLRPLLRNPGHATLLLRLHSLARRAPARLPDETVTEQWHSLAQRAVGEAPAVMAESAARQMGVQPAGDGWLFDAEPLEAKSAGRAFESLVAGESYAFRESEGWRLFGPAVMPLQRRRTVCLRMPWLPVRQTYLLTRLSRMAKVLPDGPSQLLVDPPFEGDQAVWRHVGAEVLSGPLSLSDGMARGGPDRMHWERTFQLAPGPLPRFLSRLLRDYRFPELPAIGEAAELTISFSVRRERVEDFATAPHSNSPEYAGMVTRMARTLQWAMRRWVPFVYFLENPDMYSSRVVMPILIYTASAPRALKKRREYGYEVVHKPHVLQAIRSAGTRLPSIFREFDPRNVSFGNGYNSVFRPTSVNGALNYVWRFPKQIEQLLRFDLFLIEQSINLLDAARRIQGSLHESKERLGKRFHKEVESMARAVRQRLHRNLPVDLDAYVPLLFIQSISAIGGEGLGVDIPHGAVSLRTGRYRRFYRNQPATLVDEAGFDGPAIPLKAA